MVDPHPARPADVPDVVALTQRLVRLRSVNEAASTSVEQPVADYLTTLMTSFGWTVEVQPVAPGRPNLVAVVTGRGGPGRTLLFEGHMDVVTEGSREMWSVDPYGGTIVDNRLYGRGSADMKSGLAAMICATRRLELTESFPGRIVVAALSDEEGMMLGAKHFARSALAETVDAAIVCEPEAGEICTSAKGAVRIRIRLIGAMAHGAMPDKGRNPIPGLARIIGSLAGYAAELQREVGTHPDLGNVYLTPTVISAGSSPQMNVIPAHGSLYVDVRTVPGIDHRQLLRRVESIAAEAAEADGLHAEVEVIDDRPPVQIDNEHPLVTALSEAHESVLAKRPRLGGVPGTTDGTILWRDAGIPNVVYGPGGKWIAHQVDEYVETDEIRAAERIYVEAARRFLGNRRDS